MPGTILLSVLELVDLPTSSSLPADQFSLKVVMGKKEYRSSGRENLFFPVSSLRDNLSIVLCDTKGDEIFRPTDIKTMQLVEKGSLDIMFPLEGGGCAKLKLQFSLTEEERKRVREMRESAVKRKLPKVLDRGFKNSVSEKASTLKEVTRKIHAVDSADLTQQDTPIIVSCSCSNVKEVAIDDSNSNHTETSQKPFVDPFLQTLQGRHDDSSVSSPFSVELLPPDCHQIGKTLEEQQSTVEVTTPRNVDTFSPTSSKIGENGRHNLMKINNVDKNPASNVKKMISTFEGSSSQILKDKRLKDHASPIKRSLLRKLGSGSSLERGSLVAEKSGESSITETIVKSFSSGTLSELRQEPTSVLLKSFHKQGVKTIISSGINGEVKDCHEKRPEFNNDCNLCNADTEKSKEIEIKNISNALETAISEGANAESKVHHSSPIVTLPESEEIIESHGFATEQDHLKLYAVGVDCIWRDRNDDPDEISASEPSTNIQHVTTEACLFECFSIYTGRRLCITTRTKELMNLLYGYNNSLRKFSMDKSSLKGCSVKEHVKHLALASSNEATSNQSREENSATSTQDTKANVRILEQAARIIVIVVACGAVILNTKAR